MEGYDAKEMEFSIEDFENQIRGMHNRKKHNTGVPSIQDFYEKTINDLEINVQLGLSAICLETRNMLKRFRPNALLTDIDMKFLVSFENYLRIDRNNKDTTISIKMRNIQRIVNLAIEDGLLKRENYPFGEKKYSVSKRLNHKTKKRAVDVLIIDKIKNLNAGEGTSLELAKDIFMFSYYARGMNFGDVIGLKMDNLLNDEIYYVRAKTKQPFYVPINKYLQCLIDKYSSASRPHIFPVYNDRIHKTLKQKYTRKKTALKAVNDNLKKIAVLIGLPTLKLTTYVSRHSYATNLKHAGVPTSYISEALGHHTEEQTQTYLAEFDKGVIQDLEKKIFDF